jgi:hypothetical protein
MENSPSQIMETPDGSNPNDIKTIRNKTMNEQIRLNYLQTSYGRSSTQ